MKKTILPVALIVLSVSCSQKKENVTENSNPLLREWTGPYNGVPAFDLIKVEQFKPAMEEAMAASRKEIDQIVGNKEPATFANTIEAMERSGLQLKRVQAVY